MDERTLETPADYMALATYVFRRRLSYAWPTMLRLELRDDIQQEARLAAHIAQRDGMLLNDACRFFNRAAYYATMAMGIARSQRLDYRRVRQPIAEPRTDSNFQMDFAAWKETLPERSRCMVERMAQEAGHASVHRLATEEIGKEFGIGPTRLSQIRRELLASWRRFTFTPQ